MRTGPLYLIVFLFTACSTRVKPPMELAPQSQVTKSYDSVAAFARRIEASINRQDTSWLNKVFDHKAAIARAAFSLTDSADAAGWFLSNDGFMQTTLSQRIIYGLPPGITSRLLHLIWNDRRPRAWYRIEERQLDYLELYFGEDDYGDLRVIDVRSYSDMEPLSLMMRRVSQYGPRADYSLDGQSISLAQALDSIVYFQRTYGVRVAVQYCRSLPEPVLYDKAVLSIRAKMARWLSREELMATFSDIHAKYAGDPSTAIYAMFFHFARKEWDSAMRAIDQIDKTVGGDRRLNLERAALQYRAGNYRRARHYARSYLAVDTSHDEPYFWLLKIAIYEGKFAEAVRMISNVRKFKPHFTIRSLDSLSPELAGRPLQDFVQSKEYSSWYATTYSDSLPIVK